MFKTTLVLEHGHCVLCRGTGKDLYQIEIVTGQGPDIHSHPSVNIGPNEGRSGACLRCLVDLGLEIFEQARQRQLSQKYLAENPLNQVPSVESSKAEWEDLKSKEPKASERRGHDI